MIKELQRKDIIESGPARIGLLKVTLGRRIKLEQNSRNGMSSSGLYSSG
jgi:hypothetical protein